MLQAIAYHIKQKVYIDERGLQRALGNYGPVTPGQIANELKVVLTAAKKYGHKTKKCPSSF